MSVSINSVQPATIETTKPTFKGKWSKTDQGNPYYKTNSGTVAGGVMAIPAAFVWLPNTKLPTSEEAVKKIAEEQIKRSSNINPKEGLTQAFRSGMNKGFTEEAQKDLRNLKEAVARNKRQKALAVPFLIIATGISIGCGMLIDHLRNKKAKEKADFVKQVGVKKAVIENDDIALSNKGRAYYESNVGTKYGALLGAVCGLLHTAMLRKKEYITNAITFAIGGWIMGKIADSNTNKDARKHA